MANDGVADLVKSFNDFQKQLEDNAKEKNKNRGTSGKRNSSLGDSIKKAYDSKLKKDRSPSINSLGDQIEAKNKEKAEEKADEANTLNNSTASKNNSIIDLLSKAIEPES